MLHIGLSFGSKVLRAFVASRVCLLGARLLGNCLVVRRWGLLLIAAALTLSGARVYADDFRDITLDIPQQCGAGFLPLRDNAQHLGMRIKEASARRASPKEACALIGRFHQAEIRTIRFVGSHAAECQIPPDLVSRLEADGQKTDELRKRVCDVARHRS